MATTAGARVVKVRLNNLEIGIDDETGSIVSLNSPYTGELLEASPEAAGLLDVAYPVESFTSMRLASRFSKATITQPSSDEVHIEWARLGASRQNLPIPSGAVIAQVTIRAAADGKSVIFSCHIENETGASVRQELFPDLWGLKPFAGAQATRLRLAREVVHPFEGPVPPVDTIAEDSNTVGEYYEQFGWKEHTAGFGYYNANSLRWLDYGGFDGGLSIFQKKWGSTDWPDVLTHRTEHDPNSLRIAWEHKQEIAHGQSWDSGEFWITPHAGAWAKGIEVYRDYVNQVNPPSKLPASVRDGIGFQTIWMIQAGEVDPQKAAFRFSDLPRVAEDARRYGIHEIVPWGWCWYFTLPLEIRSELGTEKEFLEAVQRSREIGVNIAPFISVTIEPNRDAERYSTTPGTENWTYDPELIPMFRPYYTRFLTGASVDTNNKAWQQDVIAALRSWIDKGLTSFTWDVFTLGRLGSQGGDPSLLTTIDTARGGERPGLLTTIDTVRKLARAKNSESTFAGESVTHLEFDSQALDYTWNWVDYEDAAPITTVLRSPRLNCNVESSPTLAKKCFADNLFLNVMPRKLDQPNGTALISEKPALAAALSTVSKLRQEFLPYFVSGTLIGDSVLARPLDAFVRGYQLKDKLLVIILNNQDQPKVLRLPSDLSLWLPKATRYEVKYYNADGKLMATKLVNHSHWEGTTGKLDPGELALFEIQSK
jgi:hypothetical protein